MKTSKKVISLLLSVIMVMTTFVIAAPMLFANAADIEINGVSQTRIVSGYETTYAKYAAEFLNGHSEPTNIVIPGLDSGDDYVTQGMSYYPQKDWMLITAYHADTAKTGVKPSMVFCIDNSTGKFVAMFSFLNVDGSANTDHGGGIAISENNIYYACGDQDRKIAYAPLDAIKGIENEPTKYREVQLVAEQDFYEIGSVTKSSKTAYTAYVCYDQGVLWTGNFYDEGAVAGFVAADYNAPANDAANSMVWGYELSGSNSTEEWANLMGATGKDCQGNPSYVISLSDNIKDVQYAVVDNGKIYVSQSYGTGKGTTSASNLGGMDDYSHLTVADIDLSVPGTKTVTFKTDANGTTRTVNDAYHISWYQTFDFMPMSEGLCVINDYVFMTFESATNKYLKKAGAMGNCKMPVDVVWKMDQHALMGEERPDDCRSMYYEKVSSLAEIEDGEEYMILFESPEKDLVTQDKYLYVLASDGGFHNYNLAKRYATSNEGYAGAVGHVIKDYEIQDNRLYLHDPENDDVIENRWTITGANSGNLRIKSASTYFSNYRNFYFNKDVIAMTNDASADLNHIGISEIGDGAFYLYYDTTPGVDGGEKYLWCNDFSVAGYENAANEWYKKQASNNIKMYSGLTETKGTFHTDGLGTTNVISQSVGENDYLRQMHIYKRVPDYYSSTVENRVYTDLNAELQSDGTYKIVMETYATDPTQYQMVDERPTDFIFVVDASSSMTNNSDVYTYTSQGVQNITFNNVKDSGWYIYYDGEYCPLGRHKYSNDDGYKIPIIGTEIAATYYHCVDFRTSDNRVFHLTPNGIVDTTLQGDGPDCDKDNGIENICKTTEVGVNAGDGKESHGTYEVFTRTGKTRLEGMKGALTNLIDNIAAMDTDHRMAVVTFGSDGADDVAWLNTGLYTNTSTTMTQYTGAGTITPEAYANVFYTASQKETVKSIVNAIDTSSKGDSDTFVNYGFDMANNIIANSDATYVTAKDMSSTSNRNVCVIMLTDGIPGKGGSNTDSANTVANATIAEAKTLKANGAYVYTIQLGNNNMDGFNMHNYLEYVSSNYLVAENMTTPGSRNTDKVDYHHDVNLNSFTTADILSNSIMSSIKDNCENATALLGPDTVIYQKLTDAFIIPEDAKMKTELVNGWYDAIGRLTFDEKGTPPAPNTITSTLTKSAKQLYVKGYDYSSHYIGNKKPGEKLRVTITGVLANKDFPEIENTSINDVSTTAVWETIDHNVPFKYFPYKTFSIPEYTYVLDYGIPMYDFDVNGTLKSVSKDLSAQRDANGNLAYKHVSENGLVEIKNNNLDLVYRTTPTNFTDSGYCLIQRDNGRYDWFSIKVVPASNVLFEESSMVDGASKANSAAWSAVTDGSPVKPYQSLTNDKTDVYGYDEAYAQTEHCYSNGGAYKAVVNASQNRSVTKTFDFVGDRFDLISACGPNTGIMVVKVSGGTLQRPKTFIVDTYYSPEGDNVNLANGDGIICQTPIVSFTGDRGTYTVEATAAYLSTAKALNKSITGTTSKGKLEATTGVPVTQADAKTLLAELGMADLANSDIELVWFDDNSVLNGGSGAKGNVRTNRAGDTTESLDCYLDGFRIYHPVSAEDIEYIESEQNAQYVNVIDCIKKGQIGTDGSASFSGIAYVEKALEGLAFANYNQVGPQNELYLKGGSTSDALVLKVNVAPNGKVHLGLRAVTGTAQVKIGVGTEEAGTAKTFTINGATEMYYDVTSYADIKEGIATITIQNTGSGVLAVNNIKLTGDNTMNLVTADDMDSAIALMNAPAEKAEVINGVVTPIVEDTDNDTDVDNGTDNDTDTGNENTGDAGSSNLSFIEQIIAKIMELLSSIFKFLPVGEVA